MNYWTIIYRFALAVLLVAVIAGLLLVFMPKLKNLNHMVEEHGKRDSEIRDLEARISELETNQRQFKSNPEFVERVAREAGMVKTNEFLYKLEP